MCSLNFTPNEKPQLARRTQAAIHTLYIRFKQVIQIGCDAQTAVESGEKSISFTQPARGNRGSNGYTNAIRRFPAFRQARKT